MSETYNFEKQTYNGISIIRETNSGFVNASQMCSSNGKKWRMFKETKAWNEILEIYDEFVATDEGVHFRAPYFSASKGVKPEFQGEYIHPKLIHFVAEYVSKRYAFQVQQLMDSIDTAIHQNIAKANVADTVENVKPLFISACETIINIMSTADKIPVVNKAFESKFCWGEHESPKSEFVEYQTLKESIDFIYAHNARIHKTLQTC